MRCNVLPLLFASAVLAAPAPGPWSPWWRPTSTKATPTPTVAPTLPPPVVEPTSTPTPTPTPVEPSPTSTPEPEPTIIPNEETAPEISVLKFAWAGSGCPADRRFETTSFTIPGSGPVNGIQLGLLTNDFTSTIGPDTLPNEARRNCQFNIQLTSPPGWQVAITEGTFKGDVNLQAGANAFQKAIYYFSGEADQVETEKSFTGPVNKKYELTHDVPEKWSPCGSNQLLNVNNAVRVERKEGAQGSISATQNGKYEVALGLVWRKC